MRKITLYLSAFLALIAAVLFFVFLYFTTSKRSQLQDKINANLSSIALSLQENLGGSSEYENFKCKGYFTYTCISPSFAFRSDKLSFITTANTLNFKLLSTSNAKVNFSSKIKSISSKIISSTTTSALLPLFLSTSTIIRSANFRNYDTSISLLAQDKPFLKSKFSIDFDKNNKDLERLRLNKISLTLVNNPHYIPIYTPIRSNINNLQSLLLLALMSGFNQDKIAELTSILGDFSRFISCKKCQFNLQIKSNEFLYSPNVLNFSSSVKDE